MAPDVCPNSQRDHTGLRRYCFLNRWRVTRRRAIGFFDVGNVYTPSPEEEDDVTTGLGPAEDRAPSPCCAGFLLGSSESADGFRPSFTFFMISFRKRGSALPTVRSYQVGIAELGARRHSAVRSSLRHPIWAVRVGNISLGHRGVNSTAKPHILEGRRKKANDVAYFVGRDESIGQSPLQWGEISRGLAPPAEYKARAFSVGSFHLG